MIYLDTSALAKLVVEEAESATLKRWLDRRPDEPLVTSALSRIELIRAATRRSPATVPFAQTLLAELAQVPLDALVVEAAATVPPPELRSLDAIHLASASTLAAAAGEGLTFVSYDDRQRAAAKAMGLDVAAPSPKV